MSDGLEPWARAAKVNGDWPGEHDSSADQSEDWIGGGAETTGKPKIEQEAASMADRLIVKVRCPESNSASLNADKPHYVKLMMIDA